MNHPQTASCPAQQVRVAARNQGSRLGPHISRQRQLERHGPLLVGKVGAEVEVPVRPLPAHVDRVVLAGQAKPVPVHGPERATRRDRSRNNRHTAGLPCLWVELRHTARCDREHFLLACHQEPRRRSRSFAERDRHIVFVGNDSPSLIRQIRDRSGRDAVLDCLDRRIDQHEQDFRRPSRRARQVNRHHVGNDAAHVVSDELRQARTTTPAQPPVNTVFETRIYTPRREVSLPPISRRSQREPAINARRWKVDVFSWHGVSLPCRGC